jgi:hypothetical protein
MTYVETATVILIAGVLTVAVLPDAGNEDSIRAQSAVERLESDIEYARSYAISRPDDKLIIRFDKAANEYWLANESSPTTPVTHPFTRKPYRIRFNEASAGELQGVEISTVDLDGGSVLAFDAFGGTKLNGTGRIEIAAGNQRYAMDLPRGSVKTTVANVSPATADPELEEGGGTQSGQGGTSMIAGEPH